MDEDECSAVASPRTICRWAGSLGSAAISRLVPAVGITAAALGAVAVPAVASALPDGRAYEVVTPQQKAAGEFGVTPGQVAAAQVAGDGNGVIFTSFGAFAGAQSSDLVDFYLSTRSGAGWTTNAISPPEALPTQNPGFISVVEATADDGKVVWSGGVPGVSGASAGMSNLYVENLADGTFQLINDPTQQPAAPYSVAYGGASSDLSHVLFTSSAPLIPGTPASSLYEWVNGQLSLESVLPDRTDAPSGASLAGGDAVQPHAVSADGSHVYFTTSTLGIPEELYLRDGGVTTQLNVPEVAGTSPASVEFWGASTDGTVAYFTTSEQLTADATPGTNLYSWEQNAPAGQQLTDLTDPTSASGTQGANVEGVLGTGDDGSYVYFVASGQLVAGEGTVGQPNLYVWHKGAGVQFIGTLNESTDDAQWSDLEGATNRLPTREVTSGGLHLVFTSTAELTTYDNAGHSEVYSYDYNTGQLNCVSCNPAGTPPAGDASLAPQSGFDIQAQAGDGNRTIFSDNARRIFFQTTDALLPTDTDGTMDVYEWEASGDGSCDSTTQDGGCLYLISSGTSTSDSGLLGTTPSGDDVFIVTTDTLVPADQDTLEDVYDARVGGGFPVNGNTVAPCSGDACQGEPTPTPTLPTVATGTVGGADNATAASASSAKANSEVKAVMLTKTVHGTSFVVKVKAPGAGRITVSGDAIKTLRRSVKRAGTYSLRAALTAKAKRKLTKQRAIVAPLRVTFAALGGRSASSTAHVTVTRGTHQARAGEKRGGK